MIDYAVYRLLSDRLLCLKEPILEIRMTSDRVNLHSRQGYQAVFQRSCVLVNVYAVVYIFLINTDFG